MKRQSQGFKDRGGLSGPIELTEQTLASAIDGHPFAVLAFWDPSSATCRAFASTLATAAVRNPDLLFGQVDFQRQKAICAHFNVVSAPTLMIFRSNIIVFVKAGRLRPGELDEVLSAVRALDMDQVRRKVADAETVVIGTADSGADSRAASPAAERDSASMPEASQLSIEAHLNPAVRAALAGAGSLLASGGLVAIRDAFQPEFAEQVHRSLHACTAWRVYEGQEDHFHYHHHNLYQPEAYPEEVARCASIFDSSRTRAWVSALSGRSCNGQTEVSASWYLPGDHSLPHNDVAPSDERHCRQVAFVWHLTKDWRPEWGGALFWCSTATYLPAAFNTLLLFNVGATSNHFVTHVSPYAQGKRLAINGWWSGLQSISGAAPSTPRRLGGDAEIHLY